LELEFQPINTESNEIGLGWGTRSWFMMSKQSCEVIDLGGQQSIATYRVRKETAEIDERLKVK
jgi:hypothetical protein